MASHDNLNAFSSAMDMTAALRRREISARELFDAHLRRVERYDPPLNSIVVKCYEKARRDALRADESRAHGNDAPLLGLPVTIKESIHVEGLPSTAGVTARVGHVATKDALSVARLRKAGAVVFGKTNVCTWLADYQADNPVYGRTNSPWDLSRTPGGSSGGSATLAAGLTALDLGTDLGGSIRVPAAFSGLWGHKPSSGIVPNSGHFPGSDWPNAALPMPVQGPHARSAGDLELALDVITGPDHGMEAGWRLELPSSRASRLRDFRIAVLPTISWLAVDEEILTALARTAEFLRHCGATIAEVVPTELGDLKEHYQLFRSMMSANVSIRWNDTHRQHVVADKLGREEEFHAADARGILATASDYLQWNEKRETYRASWRDFFRSWDILLAPITLTPAFKHTQVPNADRRLFVQGKEQEFEYMSFYPSLATLGGQPATVFPAGCNTGGLPLGLQVIGPFMEDRTTITFASLIERELGPFKRPPGYESEL